MKCPDCGSRLAEVSFGVFGGATEWAQRCFKCGGFWIDSKTANKLSAQQLSVWRRISVDPMWLRGGKGMCPQDGTTLTQYIGENIPRNITAQRCVRCGKWWFPGESLFAFKPAMDAKINYFKMWKTLEDVGKAGLPIMVAVLLVGGVVTGVNMIKTRTQIAVPAVDVVRKVIVSYVGEGQGLVTFESDTRVQPGLVKYRIDKSELWVEVITTCNRGLCGGKLQNLVEGNKYVIQVGEGEYGFVAK